ncbi:hypothetical protein [Candidatus Pristimantibacillus sp. PTI5]|uniref:hypothetical protein n=1 Tax=Candidatus Pristimantibacillus sp. PTI5 TaxID=3400422 RepID=UPI003B02D0A6
MSLCIALNNPNNFTIISGDGRITKGNQLVRDDHKKLTKLTEYISMFCSGAQDYCEELRSIIKAQVNEHTSIHEVAFIVQKASQEIQKCFENEHASYLEQNPKFSALATVISYYDKATNQSGTIEYCHTDGFIPHDSRASTMTVRGLEREKVFEYLGNQIEPDRIIESVLNTFKYISGLNKDVGGTVTIHVVSLEGIDVYEWSDYK